MYRIEELLSEQSPQMPVDCPPTVERHAQRIAAQLVARGQGRASAKSSSASSSSRDTPREPEFNSVDVDSMALVSPRTVGVEAAALWAMRQVDFVGLPQSLGFTGPQRAAALGSIIGRMAAPASELATHGWLGARSGLGELLDVDYEAMRLSSLYRISDRLLRHKPALEAALFNRVSDLFGLSTTVTLSATAPALLSALASCVALPPPSSGVVPPASMQSYDLTNTYFEGEMVNNPKARRGHSKEKRSDCPLLTLGLVLDGSGFVRRSEVFAGNVQEAQTLEGMLKGFQAPDGALVVMDRGLPPRRTWSGCGNRAIAI